MKPATARSRKLGYVRLLFAVIVFLIAILAVIPAPNYLAWKISIVVTELGSMIAVAALLVFLPGWWRTIGGRIAAGLGFGAFVLALWPLVSAFPISHGLPARLELAFGTVKPKSLPAAAPRSKPIVMRNLVFGLRPGRVRIDSATYAVSDGQRLGLDLYRPLNSGEPLPLVVVIHGGSWRSGSRHEFAELDRYLAARGYAVAAISYRFAPKYPHPAASEDVNEAIRFLKANASRFQIDPSRIALIGRSAGGQLALLAAYTAKDPAIRGVVEFYAPSDQVWGYEHPSNPRVINSSAVLESFLAGNPQTAAAAYRSASPINFVGDATPPTLLIHGAKDEIVSVHQSEMLDQKLAAVLRPHLFLRLTWATHGCDYFFNGLCGQVSTYAIERFLASVMR